MCAPEAGNLYLGSLVLAFEFSLFIHKMGILGSGDPAKDKIVIPSLLFFKFGTKQGSLKQEGRQPVGLYRIARPDAGTAWF